MTETGAKREQRAPYRNGPTWVACLLLSACTTVTFGTDRHVIYDGGDGASSGLVANASSGQASIARDYDDMGDIERCRANAYAEPGVDPGGIEACTNALARTNLSDQQRAWVLYDRGLASLAQGNAAPSIDDFNMSIDLVNDQAVVWQARGRAQMALDEHGKAIDDLNQALSLDPILQGAHALRGIALLQHGDHSLAVGDLSEAILEDPTNAGLYEARAAAFEALGDNDAAKADLNRAVPLIADDQHVLDRLRGRQQRLTN